MVAKYEAFAQGLEGYLCKKEDPDKVFVQQRWERVMKPKDFRPTPPNENLHQLTFFSFTKKIMEHCKHQITYPPNENLHQLTFFSFTKKK